MEDINQTIDKVYNRYCKHIDDNNYEEPFLELFNKGRIDIHSLMKLSWLEGRKSLLSENILSETLK